MDINTKDQLPARRIIKTKKMKSLVFIIAAALIVATGLIIARHSNTRPTAVSISSTNPLSGVEGQVNFPLYIPGNLPQGFSVVPYTANVQNGIVSFKVNYNSGQKIIVTEQARPQAIEQVVKSRQFTTPAGDGYIADLNGHTTGFIQNSKTLIIFSSALSPDSDVLEQLMTGFKGI
jgi:hypothetical protein